MEPADGGVYDGGRARVDFVLLRAKAVIQGIAVTGSIVFGVIESGRSVRNYDFEHYAHSSAVTLDYSALFALPVDDTRIENADFLAAFLAHWQADDLAILHQQGADGLFADQIGISARFGDMGRIVTAFAQSGSPLAQAVFKRAAAELGVGIRLVAPAFTGRTIDVALIGSGVQSACMRQAVERALAAAPEYRFTVVAPAFSAEIGAALMAMERHGITINDGVIENLHASKRPFQTSQALD